MKATKKLNPKTKTNKKRVTDLISLSELAKRAHVSRAAASAWLKRLESWGADIAVPSPENRNKKMVDANSPEVTAYINKAAIDRQATADKMKKTKHKLRKLKYQAEKLRLQNIILREKHIEREAVYKICDKLLELEAAVFADFSDRVLKSVQDKLHLTPSPDKVKRARELLQSAVDSAHASTRRIIQDFKKNTASPYAEKKTA